MKYVDSNGSVFTHETLEKALMLHEENGLIKGWGRYAGTYAASGTRKFPLYVVTVTDRSQVHLANVWEARAFIAGLISAEDAYKERARAEAEAAEVAECERRKRLEEERDRDIQVIETADCPYCHSIQGNKCVRKVEDETPYAAHPHSQRVDHANFIEKVRRAV